MRFNPLSSTPHWDVTRVLVLWHWGETLRYLTARSVLTLQVALLFWGQQADSSLLCCLPVLIYAGSHLCCIVLHGRGCGCHSAPLLQLLACSSDGEEAGYGFILLQCTGSKISSEVPGQRFASCWQCWQTPWCKGSICGKAQDTSCRTARRQVCCGHTAPPCCLLVTQCQSKPPLGWKDFTTFLVKYSQHSARPSSLLLSGFCLSALRKKVSMDSLVVLSSRVCGQTHRCPCRDSCHTYCIICDLGLSLSIISLLSVQTLNCVNVFFTFQIMIN